MRGELVSALEFSKRAAVVIFVEELEAATKSLACFSDGSIIGKRHRSEISKAT